MRNKTKQKKKKKKTNTNTKTKTKTTQKHYTMKICGGGAFSKRRFALKKILGRETEARLTKHEEETRNDCKEETRREEIQRKRLREK